MTDLKSVLKAAVELQGKATKGPWQQHDSDYCIEEIWGNLDLTENGVRGVQVCAVYEGPCHEADSAFIAAVRNLPLADLLTAFEGLEREVERLKGQLANAMSMVSYHPQQQAKVILTTLSDRVTESLNPPKQTQSSPSK